MASVLLVCLASYLLGSIPNGLGFGKQCDAYLSFKGEEILCPRQSVQMGIRAEALRSVEHGEIS